VLGSVWLQRAVLLGVFALLTTLTWRKWPDLIVDSGRELYVPWRLSEGDVLYRDIAHYYGPLGVTVNSWLFRCFGAGFDRIFLFNLTLLGGFVLLLHRHLRTWAGSVAALLASLVFLTGFAFGNFLLYTNYNFVSPYSNDTIYGTYLTFGVMLALGAHWRAPRTRWLVFAGLAAGGAYLTKPETTAAAAVVVAVGLLISSWIQSKGDTARWPTFAGRLGKETLILAGAALLPLLLFTAWFVVKVGGSQGWLAIHSSWISVFSTSTLRASATNLAFTGWDAPAANLAKVLRAGGITVLVVIFLGLFALVAGRARALQPSVALAALLGHAGLTIAIGFFLWKDPLIVGHGLTVTAAVLWAWRLGEFLRAERTGDSLVRAGAALLWSSFAAAMLLKMLLNPRLAHYGFFQAMPATLDLLMFVVADIPRLLRRHGGIWPAGLAAGVLLAAVFAFVLGKYSLGLWGFKTLPVDEGPDRLYTYPAEAIPLGSMVESTRRLVLSTHPDAKSLVVFPEGAMINYLLRLKCPLPTIEFVPPALAYFGQDKLLAGLAASPPDLVILLTRDIREFGSPVFGHDEASGQRIFRWLEQHYEVSAQFGGNPLDFRQMGVVTLRRKARVPAAPPSH
jgi:hypothetical protein